ncbi:hypothetical protein [Nocardioides ungokensis]|uniref:hypothetical protein n=1 Tax=Nocardioides ungokensis TaxID=1643322 RepID=UPI0015DE9FF9|nr:hypothetical protein [Nocardioides ungokensis]
MNDTTTYDPDKLERLKADRKTRVDAARQIVDRARGGSRDLDPAEATTVETAMNSVKQMDVEIKDQQAAMMRAVFGSPDSRGDDDATKFLSLRSSGIKSDLAARFGNALGTPGTKALVDTADPYTSIPMDPEPYRLGDAPTSLIEVLPSVVRPVTYRYMRQTTRTNNAAPVAPATSSPSACTG